MRRTLELSVARTAANPDEPEKLDAPAIKRIAPLLSDIDALKKHAHGFTAELTPSNIPRITQFIRKVKAAGKDKFDIATLTESLEESDAQSAEWFIIHASVEFKLDMRWKTGLTSAKADKQKPHHVQRYATDIFISDSARSIIERHKLRGLEYVWVKGTGKFHAPQWFHIFASAPLGRGIDHPWFDPKTYGTFSRYGAHPDDPFQSKEPAWRRGVDRFNFRQLRANPKPAPPELADLLRALRTDLPLTSGWNRSFFEAPRLVLRQFLPESDFAYAWLHPIDLTTADTAGYLLCASRRARDLLIASRLATAKDFDPIRVLDRPPKDVELLDRSKASFPGPVFAGERLQTVRAAEKDALAKHTPKPQKPTDFKPALTLLKRRAKRDKFRKGAAAPAISAAEKKLKLSIPARWREVLALADGFQIEPGNDDAETYSIASTVDLPEAHRSSLSMARLTQPKFPSHMLGIGDTDSGDGLFLDTSKSTKDGDCPILSFDHETGETNTWPNLASFLTELLAPPQEE